MSDSSPNAVEDDASTGDEPGGPGDEALQPDRDDSPDAPKEGVPNAETFAVVRTALGALRAYFAHPPGDDENDPQTND